VEATAVEATAVEAATAEPAAVESTAAAMHLGDGRRRCCRNARGSDQAGDSNASRQRLQCV
jgi:hypothetical protein